MKLGIVGAGCIGRRIGQAVHQHELDFSITAVCDIDCAAADALIAEYAPLARRLDLRLAAEACDVLVECASGAVVGDVLAAARDSHGDCGSPGHVLVMSVGGLLGQAVDLPGPIVHVPSGAIGGLDAIAALAVAGLEEVVLTTRKPPDSLDMQVTEETVVFEGPAEEVIRRFPKNVNVAIALSLAGIGPHRTMVRLVADPAVSRNTHHVVARGPAGEVEFISRNERFPQNPRTSYLAALSAIALLRRIAGQLQVG
jgi:aspartate dehydrogenase